MFKIFSNILCCLFLCSHFFCILQATTDNQLVSKSPNKLVVLPHLIKANNWNKISRLIKHEDHISLAKLDLIARYNHSKPLSRAISAVKEIRNSSNHSIEKGKLLRAALFMETQLPHYIKTNQFHVSRKKSKLPFAVEYDPENKNRFILLGNKLGAGKWKVVTQGVLYDQKNPKLIARGTQKYKKERRPMIKREINVSKKLKSSPGIVETESITKTRSRGKKYYSFYYSFYNGGSLRNVFSRKTKFSLKEKVGIASDIINGLHSLHSKGIAHADLGFANYLVNISENPKTKKRVVKACIADLGRADYISNHRDGRVQGHAAYTSPEALYAEKMSGKDYLRADVYAAGCALYGLFYDKSPSWCDSKWVSSKNGSLKSRYNKLASKIERKTKERRIFLDKKRKSGDIMTRSDDFERLVLYMVHTDPHERGDATYLRKEIEKIKERFPK